VLCLLFSYLYQQSRQLYFRAWQIAWACYSIHYAWMPSAITGRRRCLRFLASLVVR